MLLSSHRTPRKPSMRTNLGLSSPRGIKPEPGRMPDLGLRIRSKLKLRDWRGRERRILSYDLMFM
jgi:hypothetical protein